MKRYFKLMAVVVAVIASGAGVCSDVPEAAPPVTVSTTFSWGRGDQITPYLEKIYILAGSPGPETAAVAAALAQELPQPCEVIPYGAPAQSYDRKRAIAFWLGRGLFTNQEMGPVVRPRASMFSPETEKTYNGKPAYMLRLLRPDSLHSGRGRYIAMPDFEYNFMIITMVSRDSDEAGVKRVASDIVEKLNPALGRFRGPDAVRLPEIPERFRPALLSDDDLEVPGVAGWRKLVSSDDINGESDELYTFTKGNWESDLAAVSAALAERGLLLNEMRYQNDIRIFESKPYGESGAELYWWRIPGQKRYGIDGAPIEFSQALVVWRRPGIPDFGAELADWLRENDLRVFVLSRGLSGVKDLKERRELAEKFFALQPKPSAALRLRALETAGSSAELMPVVGAEFRRLANDVVADYQGDLNYNSYISSLFQFSEKWETLRNDLYAALGDRLCIITLPAAGTAREVVELPLADVTKFRKVFVLRFEKERFRDLLLNVGVLPDPEHPGQFIRQYDGSSHYGVTLENLGRDMQVIGFRREKFGSQVERFWPYSWGTRRVDSEDNGLTENYAMTVFSHVQPDKKQLVFEVQYQGDSEKKLAFEARLAELGKLKDDARRAAAEEAGKLLQELKGTREWSGCAMKLYKAAPENFPPEMLWTIEFTGEPGEDGLLRFEVERSFEPEQRPRGGYKPAAGFQYLVTGKLAGKTMLFPLVMTPTTSKHDSYRVETGDVIDESGGSEWLAREAIRLRFWGRGATLSQSGMSRLGEAQPLTLDSDEAVTIQRRIDFKKGLVRLEVLAKP